MKKIEKIGEKSEMKPQSIGAVDYAHRNRDLKQCVLPEVSELTQRENNFAVKENREVRCAAEQNPFKVEWINVGPQ